MSGLCFLKELEVGARIVVICRYGYQRNGDIVRRCQENGRWSSGYPRCPPVNCHPLHNISHGVLSTNETHYRAVTRYQCDPGYIIQGVCGCYRDIRGFNLRDQQNLL